MKRSFTILVFLLIISCKDIKKANENYDNCLQIEIGMSIEDVTHIMGEPDTILTKSNIQMSTYIMYYKPPPMSSAGIDIYIDKETENVIEVVCSE